MGICVSSQYTTANNCSTMRLNWPRSTTQIIHWDGKLQELKQAVKAAQVLSRNPNCFLCSSESMFVGAHLPQLGPDEDLQLGQIYFVLPLSHYSRAPLTLQDLCALAIKASSALSHRSTATSSTTNKALNGSQGYCCKIPTSGFGYINVSTGNPRIKP